MPALRLRARVVGVNAIPGRSSLLEQSLQFFPSWTLAFDSAGHSLENIFFTIERVILFPGDFQLDAQKSYTTPALNLIACSRGTGSGRTPEQLEPTRSPVILSSYRWQRHCRWLYQTPTAA
jgi:hypothetical protein